MFKFINVFCEIFDIFQYYISVYYFNINGLVERQNSVIV